MVTVWLRPCIPQPGYMFREPSFPLFPLVFQHYLRHLKSLSSTNCCAGYFQHPPELSCFVPLFCAKPAIERAQAFTRPRASRGQSRGNAPHAVNPE